MKEFIGRIVELNALRIKYESTISKFVAVYGRRRVGKTYLIFVRHRSGSGQALISYISFAELTAWAVRF